MHPSEWKTLDAIPLVVAGAVAAPFIPVAAWLPVRRPR
jgi:hypothetical protein